jgi:hypothetical protein
MFSDNLNNVFLSRNKLSDYKDAPVHLERNSITLGVNYYFNTTNLSCAILVWQLYYSKAFGFGL